jgi:hypothetical protein
VVAAVGEGGVEGEGGREEGKREGRRRRKRRMWVWASCCLRVGGIVWEGAGDTLCLRWRGWCDGIGERKEEGRRKGKYIL